MKDFQNFEILMLMSVVAIHSQCFAPTMTDCYAKGPFWTHAWVSRPWSPSDQPNACTAEPSPRTPANAEGRAYLQEAHL